ncbi:Asp-tRNA(Asn)/Glu-tRNA(Gln) amidotransferase A subunit family amidase [Bradyrhizobium sp. LM3.2]
MDFDQLTLTQAAADLRAGKITSTALTTEALARAKANADLNAFVTLDEAGALKAAAVFDATGDRRKPLGGVPVVIKDNIEVAGLPCSAGTPALKQYVPKADAPVCRKAARRGRGHHRQNQHARARLRHLRLQHRIQDRRGVRRAQRL